MAGRVGAGQPRTAGCEAGRQQYARRPAGDRPGKPGPETHHVQGADPFLDPAGHARRDGRGQGPAPRKTARPPGPRGAQEIAGLFFEPAASSSPAATGSTATSATVFIEGVQSLSFKKFKLDQGVGETDVQGMGIDKLWFYPSQGVVVNSHWPMRRRSGRGRPRPSTPWTSSMIFSTPPTLRRGERSISIRVSTLDLSRKSALSLNADYVTGNMSSARLALLTKWTPRWSSECGRRIQPHRRQARGIVAAPALRLAETSGWATSP